MEANVLRAVEKFRCNQSFIYNGLMGEVEPIPLTEGWLLKFGFQNVTETENANHPLIRTFSKGIFKIYIPEGKCRLFGMIGVDSAWLNMRYVHQLQNLYFALTGTELECAL